MTIICGDASGFALSALHGYSLANRHLVRMVRGGVVRATPGRPGKVAVVVGGGSGHYPAFNGYVGAGFADAAVAGDIFASPSTQAIHAVARRAERGGGVILGFGNYAGDVLNFGIAAERLREAGIDTRLLATTDDVASAEAADAARRRGVAGDLAVFKIVGAAAEAGLDIDAVEAIGQRANRQTRTFGVAFDGCTLPGDHDRLFHVAPNRMALGLGVHGEPGVDEQDIPTPAQLAHILFDRVVAELPDDAPRRVAIILNGLGSTTPEELFVLWEALFPLLARAGLHVIAPLVGEYVTSLDMAGCSLTMTWLDAELEHYWRAPVETAALRHTGIQDEPDMTDTVMETEPPPAHAPAPTAEGRRGGLCMAEVMAGLAQALAAAETQLGQIDAVAGDGDHGQGMARGSGAARHAARVAAMAHAGAATVLAAAADAWADRAGGTSGALWGEGLRAFSMALDDASLPDAAQLIQGARRAMERVMQLGKARRGDKTLLDALVPFVETLEHEHAMGLALPEAWRRAVEAAQQAADATRDLMPRMGRARTHGARSLGHPDAGALSLALCLRVAGAHLPDATPSPAEMACVAGEARDLLQPRA